jgi:hypothetical protein
LIKVTIFIAKSPIKANFNTNSIKLYILSFTLAFKMNTETMLTIFAVVAAMGLVAVIAVEVISMAEERS